jgi:hypothetical protein
MDCLRSFSQSIVIQNTLTSLNANKSFWTVGSNIHCSAIATFAAGAGPTVFKPQGFKNIDIYAIGIQGEIISDPTNLTQGGIINTWGVLLNTVGNYSEISGVFSNQGLTVNENPITLSLSRYTNYVAFSSPIKSIENISFNNIYIQASACQSAIDLKIFGQLQLTVYYKFEGE